MRGFKTLVFSCVCLILSISLLGLACGQQPSGGAGPTVTVTKTTTATATVTAQPTTKPAKTYTWQPSTWTGSGAIWDDLIFMADYVNRMADGRLVYNPSAPGALAAVNEQLDAVSLGITPAMDMYPGYFSGKIPLELWHGSCLQAPPSAADMRTMFDVYESGRANQLFQQEYDKFGDVHLVRNHYYLSTTILTSKVPLNGVEDLNGITIRATDFTSKGLALLGAGTVFAPGSEIYTMLSTGAIDAAIFDNAAGNVGMSIHEVTKYWVKKPSILAVASNAFIVNGTVWNELPDDLKAIVEASVDAAVGRNLLSVEYEINKAWKFAQDYGIVVQEWSDEDVATVREAYRSLFSQYQTDDATKEMGALVQKYMLEMGYWK